MKYKPANRWSLDEAESWFAFFARIISFFLGITILAWQTFGTKMDRPYLIVAGVGLCGPVVAQSVATVFAAIRGGGKIDDEW